MFLGLSAKQRLVGVERIDLYVHWFDLKQSIDQSGVRGHFFYLYVIEAVQECVGVG